MRGLGAYIVCRKGGLSDWNCPKKWADTINWKRFLLPNPGKLDVVLTQNISAPVLFTWLCRWVSDWQPSMTAMTSSTLTVAVYEWFGHRFCPVCMSPDFILFLGICSPGDTTGYITWLKSTGVALCKTFKYMWCTPTKQKTSVHILR